APRRSGAVKTALEWIINHQDADGVWGGIQPPWIYSLMALCNEGYAHTHPVVAKAIAALDDPRWRVDVEDVSYIQASVSPVWDTVLSLLAVQDCDAEGVAAEEVERAIDWVLSKEVRAHGDWGVKVKGVEPGGWAFQYENLKYPDVDDTAVALIVLAPYRNRPGWAAKGVKEAIDRAVSWVLAMQCRNGGWAAFDKDNDKRILTKIPFCDFGEALDPPSVDVTAHVLEALGALGYDARHPAVARGLAYLKAEQEADGSWFGRWGVNYVYGAGAVLPALKAVGVDMRSDFVLKAADWLASTQQADGAWGESCASYMDPSQKAKGRPTPSQTAWAMMGLLAVARPEDRAAIERGVAYLTNAQADGTWDEPEYTGTGFPGYGVGATIRLDDPKLQERLAQGPELSRAFMINYNMYRHYFPLMALGRARDYLDRRPNSL
ncbi:MAG: squalene--hopene cyclase, partial [Pseudomonadota bacterium]